MLRRMRKRCQTLARLLNDTAAQVECGHIHPTADVDPFTLEFAASTLVASLARQLTNHLTSSNMTAGSVL